MPSRRKTQYICLKIHEQRNLIRLSKKQKKDKSQNIKESTSQANPYMDDNVVPLSFSNRQYSFTILTSKLNNNNNKIIYNNNRSLSLSKIKIEMVIF